MDEIKPVGTSLPAEVTAAISTVSQHLGGVAAPDGQNFGEELLHDVEGVATGYLDGGGWDVKQNLPNGLSTFTLKSPLGVTFDCTGGYQDGKLVFKGVPRTA